MRHLVAGLLVGATLFSPLGASFSTSALAVDCTDPANQRPGGYCSITSGPSSLSTPADPFACMEEPEVIPLAVLSEAFISTPGARVHVAQVYCDEEEPETDTNLF